MKQQKNSNTEAGLKYRQVKKEVRKKMKAAKEKWTEEQCKNTEGNDVSKTAKRPKSTLKLSSHQDPTSYVSSH